MGIESSKAFRIAVIGMIAGAISWGEPHVRVVRSPSIRYSVLWEVRGPVGKGDYVNVPLPAQFRRLGRPTLMTKRIGCVAGEMLRAANGGHYCNDVWLGAVLKFGSDGRPLEPFVWSGQVPSGKVYLVGDDPRSFDSRYLGFFDAKDAVRLKALL